MLLVSSIWDHLNRSTAIPALNRDDLYAQTLPLPPLPEQHRIVAEIETQFTRLDAGVAALKRVQAGLQTLRAAVLKAACEGRLVPTEAELAGGRRRERMNRRGAAGARPGRARPQLGGQPPRQAVRGPGGAGPVGCRSCRRGGVGEMVAQVS